MPREPALLTSAGRMPERSRHRVSEGQDGRSERPATGHGQPLLVGYWNAIWQAVQLIHAPLPSSRLQSGSTPS